MPWPNGERPMTEEKIQREDAGGRRLHDRHVDHSSTADDTLRPRKVSTRLRLANAR